MHWEQRLGTAMPYVVAHALMGKGAPRGQDLEWKRFQVEPVEIGGEVSPAQLVIMGVTRGRRPQRPFTYNAFNFSLAIGEGGLPRRLPQFKLGRVGIHVDGDITHISGITDYAQVEDDTKPHELAIRTSLAEAVEVAGIEDSLEDWMRAYADVTHAVKA